MKAVLTFPVLPGKTEADIRKVAEHFNDDPRGYWESRREAGITLERAYWQHTPMGDFVVAYIEGDKGFEEGMAAMANPTTDMGRWFMQTVREIHGVDMSQPPSKAPEIIGDWSDPESTTRQRGFAFCAPAVPDEMEFGRDWARRTFASEGMTQSRRNLGENHEIAMLHHTEQGPVIAVYLEGADPEGGNRRFAASQDPFDVEFKETCKRIFPSFVDFSQPIQGITEIFDSEKLPVSV